MINPKETLNNLLHGKTQDEVQTKDAGESTDNPYSIESENLAMPEVHTSKDHEEKLREREAEQNQSSKKEEFVFDTLAVPEIHIKN